MSKQSVTIQDPKQMTLIGQTIRSMLEVGKVKITLEHPQDSRSIAQNKLLWLWHGEMAKHILEHVGQTYSSEEIHEYIVDKLLPKKVLTVMGEPMIKRGQTSKLGVKAFAEFLNHYEGWALTTYECQFPHPDDIYHQAIGQAQ